MLLVIFKCKNRISQLHLGISLPPVGNNNDHVRNRNPLVGNFVPLIGFLFPHFRSIIPQSSFVI